MLIVRASFENFLLDESYFSLLLAHLQSFESYVRRDTHYAVTKKTYFLSFIKIIRQLAEKMHKKNQLKTLRFGSKLRRLQTFLYQQKNGLEKKWIFFRSTNNKLLILQNGKVRSLLSFIAVSLFF